MVGSCAYFIAGRWAGGSKSTLKSSNLLQRTLLQAATTKDISEAAVTGPPLKPWHMLGLETLVC